MKKTIKQIRDKKKSCAKCGALLDAYWLKDGVCNGCRNPHLVVVAQPKPSIGE